jgi:hypothetical protein
MGAMQQPLQQVNDPEQEKLDLAIFVTHSRKRTTS